MYKNFLETMRKFFPFVCRNRGVKVANFMLKIKKKKENVNELGVLQHNTFHCR